MTAADPLRRAAALMRERAGAATPGPWESLGGGDRLVAWRVGEHGFDDDFEYVADEPIGNEANAEHIASWHPAVALAVADLLDAQATFIEQGGDFSDIEGGGDANALAIARAYIGEQP